MLTLRRSKMSAVPINYLAIAVVAGFLVG
jgi:hypothetical protein